jgi:hypothetical protein
MTVDRLFIVSKSGGLIYSYDNQSALQSVEQTVSYPLPFKLASLEGKVCVDFGQQDGIKPGFTLLNYNEFGTFDFILI